MIEKINAVNDLLQAQGRRVIQRIQIGNRQAMYGYKPQFVFDAINEIFGPENWNYELHDNELFASGDDGQSGQVVVSVEVFLRSDIEGEFVSHGIQYGQSQVIYGNIGDARKGAITDAVQKGLSGFSIAKMAYRGELEAVYQGHTKQPANPPLREVPTPTKTQPVKSLPSVPTQTQTDSGLPDLPGVTYETAADGTIVAQGDTYNNRTLLKSLGFIWLPKEKAWGLKQAA